MESVSISLATEAEAPACLAILPEAQGTRSELLIARLDGRFAGAAALAWASWSKPAGFPLFLRVLEPAQRRGVGRALVHAAARLSQPETDGLWSMQGVEDDSVAAAFMLAAGFSVQSREVHFQGGIPQMTAYTTSLAERLRARGRAPMDAKLVPLAEAPLEAVAWLISSQFNNGPVQLLNSLRHSREGNGSIDLDMSVALLQGDEVAGVVILEATNKTVVTVAANVVAPQWRGGWAGALLLEAGTRRALERKFEQVAFYCDDTVRDTMRIAERGGATLTRSTARYYYAIAG